VEPEFADEGDISQRYLGKRFFRLLYQKLFELLIKLNLCQVVFSNARWISLYNLLTLAV
jgi:hypothetical protein